jgi:methylglutaconyl-CoA hydratase
MTEGKDMSEHAVICEIDARGVATATLNRPESFNGLSTDMLRQLVELFDRCELDRKIRVLCLRANGKHFSAGADIKRITDSPSAATTPHPAPTLLDILHRLNALNTPTVVLVHGACMGGAAALVACCDIVVASADARFGITEVRLAIPPVGLLPYFMPAMGPRELRRYALTGERFDADEAYRIGLVHHLCAANELSAVGARLVDELLHSEPMAVSETKAAILKLAGGALSHEGAVAAEDRTAAHMTSPEVAEGVAAFREKRAPRWYPPPLDPDQTKS